MNCEQARVWIQDACDGSLPLAEQAQLASHLAACAGCRAYEVQMRTIFGGLAALQIESERAFSPGAAAGSAGRVESKTRSLRIRPRAAFAVMGIAAAVLLGIGIAFWRPELELAVPRSETPPVLVQATESAPPSATLRDESDRDFLLVRKETSEPRVHLYQMYPVYTPPAGG